MNDKQGKIYIGISLGVSLLLHFAILKTLGWAGVDQSRGEAVAFQTKVKKHKAFESLTDLDLIELNKKLSEILPQESPDDLSLLDENLENQSQGVEDLPKIDFTELKLSTSGEQAQPLVAESLNESLVGAFSKNRVVHEDLTFQMPALDNAAVTDSSSAGDELAGLSDMGGNELELPGLSSDLLVGDLALNFQDSELTPLEGEVEDLVELEEEEALLVFDNFIEVKTKVYRDYKTLRGYYEIALTPTEDSERLPEVPKDILFIIDTSASISGYKLRKFKKALSESLSLLKANDRFNIVSFTTEAKPCFTDFIKVSPENLKVGRRFLKKLRSSGKTDVYASVKPFVESVKIVDQRPVLFFLISDGMSTVNKLASSELIKLLTEENKSKVSISAFSCGDDIDTFLLDFLTFRNRGYSLPTHNERIADAKLLEYLSKTSRVIISDLKHSVDKDLLTEMYPRSLPHMYKGQTLKVYGSFPLDKKEMIFRILGRSGRGSEDILFKVQFSKNLTEDRQVARNWAAKKTLDLLGFLDDKNRQEVLAKIRKISQEFNIIIPYKF